MDDRKAKYLSRGTSALGRSRTFSMRARFCWTAATAAVTALLPTRPPSPPMLRRKGAMVSSFTASAGKSPAEPNPLSFIPTPSMPHGPAHRNKPRGRRGGGQRSVGERERARSLCAKSEGARWRSDDARVPGRGRGDRQPSESAPLIAAPRRVVWRRGRKSNRLSLLARNVPASSSGKPVCSWMMSNSDAKLYMPCVCETGWDCQLGSGTLASARGWGRPARPSSHSRDLFAIGGVSREIAMPYRVSETAQQVGVEGVIATDSGGDGLDGGHPTRLPRSRVPYRVDPRARAPQCVSA